jgi:PadR family transcriptional regulator PadR
MNKNYIGASSDLLVLTLIHRRDMYGYEIIKNLEIVSENVFQFKEGTLYPILHRLESQKYLKSYLKKNENNQERKYYSITQNGIKQLTVEKENWKIFHASISKVIDAFVV